MKIVTKLIVTILLSLFTASASMADSNDVHAMPNPSPPPTSISGTTVIHFNTLTGASKTDEYKLNFNVCNVGVFDGTLNANTSSVNYNIECDLINPKNPNSGSLTVGRITGTVPIDAQNRYQYSDGNITCSILAHGRAQGFDSKFSGLVLGKPPKNSPGWWARFKHQVAQAQEAVTFSRKVNGKILTATLTAYDKLEFQNHVLPAAPTQNYPEATVTGTLYYDYGSRNTWFLRNIRVSYAEGQTERTDTLTGTVRWVKDKDYDHNGISHYEFDIRYNEPPVSESAAFDPAAQDDSGFFENDTSLSSLTGNMNYIDTFAKDQTVTASTVSFNLTGNRITKQQAMYTAKLILFSAVVPWNGP